MSDGRRVPGYDNIQRNDSSYFGLSLRMPTDSQSPSVARLVVISVRAPRPPRRELIAGAVAAAPGFSAQKER